MDIGYPVHRIVGIYPDRRSAESARLHIQQLGLAPAGITLIDGASAKAGTWSANDEVLSHLLREGAIGSVVATPVASGISIDLAASNLTLIIMGPVVSALCLSSESVKPGGPAGGAMGGDTSASDLPTLIDHALRAGHVVLVIHTCSGDDTLLARDVLSRFDDRADSLAGPGRQARATVAR